MTTGAAATSRSVKESTAGATLNNTTPTKNTRRPLRSRSRRVPIIAASNYATSLAALRRFKEAKSLLRRTLPVMRRVHGESHELTISMRQNFATVLFRDDGATLDDLREAVTMYEETERIARRVFGGAHPLTVKIGGILPKARAALRAREATEPSA